jgi:hypothetical protein
MYVTNWFHIDLLTLTDCIQWTRYSDQHSLLGSNLHQYVTVADCLAYCAGNSLCVAVDFDSSSAAPCWIHTNATDLSVNRENLKGRTQYVLSTQCTETGKDTPGFDWTRGISPTN